MGIVPAILLSGLLGGMSFSQGHHLLSWDHVPRPIVPVQIPYSEPPTPEFPEIQRATPAPETLTEQELQRAEAMLPMLEGRQELYAIGEFVHLGKPVIPVLVKALKMPGTRIRYNAIETMSIIKDSRVVPDLLEVATNTLELTRVRAHALRVSVRLAPLETVAALQTLVKDPSDTMRRTAAFEARYVKQLAVPPLLIELLGDPERYVAVTALESFWKLTGFSGDPHDWQGSTQEQRKLWGREWTHWWDTTLKNRESERAAPSSEPVS